MAIKARQITLVTSTATPLLVKGTGATQFGNISGTITDPLPIMIKNEDSATTVWVGGSDVDATHGMSIAPGTSLTFNVYGNDIPYVFAVGTPIISVLVGRQ